MALPVWLQGDAQHVILSLHVQPGARQTEIVGLHGDALKVRLAAPPVDGKANAALCAYLAGMLQIPKNRIELLSGASSRSKRVLALGVSVQALMQRLADYC